MKKLITIIMFMIMVSGVNAQSENRFGFGAEIGVMNETISGGNFAIGFNADYKIAENFSIAEVITFIPRGDLSQANFNTVARFNIPLSQVSLIPYLGIGFSAGKMSRDGETDRAFGFAFPIGVTLVYNLAANIAATARTQYSMYTLDYGAFGEDTGYFELMFGLRFIP